MFFWEKSTCYFLFLSSCSFLKCDKHIIPIVITIIGTSKFIIIYLYRKHIKLPFIRTNQVNWYEKKQIGW